MDPLYRQALRYLDDVPTDDKSIQTALEEKWSDFKGFSFATRAHVIEKMVELRGQGADSHIHANVLQALEFLDNVPAHQDIIRQALCERWPQFDQISDKALDLVIAEVYNLMIEKEFSEDEAPFRLALEHLGDVANEEDAIRTALRERWPEFEELDYNSGGFLMMKLRKVMAADPADSDWLFWFSKKPLKSEDAKLAANWVCQSMQTNHRQVWLVGCSYYQPPGRSDLAPLLWEICFVDLRTGELVLSAKVDYNSTTPERLYKKLYGKEPVTTSNRFQAFEDAFERHYDTSKTFGVPLSTIEHRLRNIGFNPKTHQLVSYDDDVAITAMAKLLMKDHRVSAQKFEFDMLNRELFQPVSIKSLAEEIYDTNESNDLGVVYARMFSDARNDNIPTAESNAKALWRVCSRLYQAFGFRDI